MRRYARIALALALTVGAAALGGTASAASHGGAGAVVTFTRAAAAPTTVTRTWYIISGRGALGTCDPDTEECDPGAGDGYDASDIPELPTSLPRDPAARLQLLHAAGVATDADTLEAALDELELPFMFAGREQWVLNLTTADGAASDPRLWNVSMESPVHEPNAMRMLLGRASWAVSERRTMADDVAYWETLVPSWAKQVRDDLAKQGIPFSVELLASPGIDVMDAAKPLFAKGARPVSLQQLGVDQAGESSWLRSLSAEELMRTVWPMYYRYHHRAAGEPVPDDLSHGLMFGQVWREPCTENTANGCVDGWRWRGSPLMDTDAYKRWVAYGTPGDAERNGFVVDDALGYAYSPLTGKFWKFNDGWGDPYSTYRKMMLDAMMSGRIRPEYFYGVSWHQVVEDLLVSRIAVAGYLNDPSWWFAGPNEPYGPDKIDQATKDRYLALISEK